MVGRWCILISHAELVDRACFNSLLPVVQEQMLTLICGM